MINCLVPDRCSERLDDGARGCADPKRRSLLACGAIEAFITDDAYRPHAFDELSKLVTSRVAAHLDPGELYGVWWYNRKRVKRSQTSEPDSEGRVYRRRRKYEPKDRSEWIAVPMPAAGTPLEVVEAACGTVCNYKTDSRVSGRLWDNSKRLSKNGTRRSTA